MNQAVRHTQSACLQASQPISLVNKLPVTRALPHFKAHSVASVWIFLPCQGACRTHTARDLISRPTLGNLICLCLKVCGVYIQSSDNEARRRDHVEGKQYLGGRVLGCWYCSTWYCCWYWCWCWQYGTGGRGHHETTWGAAMQTPARWFSSCCCCCCCCRHPAVAGWLAIREKHRELSAKYAGGGYPPLGPPPQQAPPAAHRCVFVCLL